MTRRTEVLLRTDLIQFLERIGANPVIVDLPGGRKSWVHRADCPLCQTQRNIRADGARGYWKCVSCQKKGNAIDLVAHLYGCSLDVAEERLWELLEKEPVDDDPGWFFESCAEMMRNGHVPPAGYPQDIQALVELAKREGYTLAVVVPTETPRGE